MLAVRLAFPVVAALFAGVLGLGGCAREIVAPEPNGTTCERDTDCNRDLDAGAGLCAIVRLCVAGRCEGDAGPSAGVVACRDASSGD